tara:strand:- start:6215 stop:6586 length:372 start_codon:yes stop_codon:yes gene_type:complete
MWILFLTGIFSLGIGYIISGIIAHWLNFKKRNQLEIDNSAFIINTIWFNILYYNIGILFSIIEIYFVSIIILIINGFWFLNRTFKGIILFKKNKLFYKNKESASIVPVILTNIFLWIMFISLS